MHVKLTFGISQSLLAEGVHDRQHRDQDKQHALDEPSGLVVHFRKMQILTTSSTSATSAISAGCKMNRPEARFGRSASMAMIAVTTIAPARKRVFLSAATTNPSTVNQQVLMRSDRRSVRSAEKMRNNR